MPYHVIQPAGSTHVTKTASVIGATVKAAPISGQIFPRGKD